MWFAPRVELRARTVEHRLLGLATRRVVAETREQRDAAAAGAGRPDRPPGGGERGRGVDGAARAGRRSSSSCGPGHSGPPARGRSTAARRPWPGARRRPSASGPSSTSPSSWPRRARSSSPGAIHSYDVIVGGQGLRDARAAARRGPARQEATDRRPVRCASPSATSSTGCRASSRPAPTIADLVLVQGSCRRTNAAGPDAMAYLDDLIAEHRLDLTRAPAAALPHRRPDLRRRPVGVPAAADQRASAGSCSGFTETLPIDDRRRPGRRSRSSHRAAPPQGGPGDRSLLDQRRPAPPALLRRAAWRCTCWCGALAVAPAGHGRRGVRAVHRRSRPTTCRTGRRTTRRRSPATRIPTD